MTPMTADPVPELGSRTPPARRAERAAAYLRLARRAAQRAANLAAPDLRAAAGNAALALRGRFGSIKDPNAWDDARQETLQALVERLMDVRMEPIDGLPDYALAVMRRLLTRHSGRKNKPQSLDSLPGGGDTIAAPESWVGGAEAFDPVAFAEFLDRQAQPVAPVRLSEVFHAMWDRGLTVAGVADRFGLSPAKVRQLVKAVGDLRRAFPG